MPEVVRYRNEKNTEKQALGSLYLALTLTLSRKGK